MKKIKYMLLIVAMAAITMTAVSCRDDFAETNTSQTAITSGNPSFLFAQAVINFEPSSYLYWFYNASEIYQWVQTGVSTGGVTPTVADGAAAQNFRVIDVLKYANELKHVRSKMTDEESAQYSKYAAAIDVLCVYMGIYDSDFIGNISYTEAAQAAHGGTLTPKYDKVEDLYDLWLTTLDQSVTTLTTAQNQIFQSAQDVVYNGNTVNWAKLANSLKLKIAARLINIDRDRAFQIAKSVANAQVGYVDNMDENFIFNKAISSTADGGNDVVYHFGDNVLQSVGGSKTMIDLMVRNRDPRVRFIFKKNSWNSKIVQLFFDAKRHDDIPKYIMDNVEYTIGADGIYQFQSWKGAGEPWVRYYGLPLEFNAAQQAAIYGDWYNYTVRCRYDDNHTYRPYSLYQDEMVRGRIDFTYPTRPEDEVIRDDEDVPWWGMYLSAAEVNLYLAEFALLGADLPQSATIYYNRALEASVREYDMLAGKNKIPYYGTTRGYDPNDRSIELRDGEIETMKTGSDYTLTGDRASDLEKVYIQQLLHFALQPVDQYTTARRSGVPVTGSAIFSRMEYAEMPVTVIPRRMALNMPTETDLMYNVLMQSYEEQGLSIGSGEKLNSERLWQDKESPQWGAGPNL